MEQDKEDIELFFV